MWSRNTDWCTALLCSQFTVNPPVCRQTTATDLRWQRFFKRFALSLHGFGIKLPQAVVLGGSAYVASGRSSSSTTSPPAERTFCAFPRIWNSLCARAPMACVLRHPDMVHKPECNEIASDPLATVSRADATAGRSCWSRDCADQTGSTAGLSCQRSPHATQPKTSVHFWIHDAQCEERKREPKEGTVSRRSRCGHYHARHLLSSFRVKLQTANARQERKASTNLGWTPVWASIRHNPRKHDERLATHFRQTSASITSQCHTSRVPHLLRHLRVFSFSERAHPSCDNS